MLGVTVKAGGPSGWGTKVINAATGDEIQGVRAMTIRITPDEFIQVEAEIFAAHLDVNGLAEFLVADPASGERKPVKQIIFADGSSWSADDEG